MRSKIQFLVMVGVVLGLLAAPGFGAPQAFNITYDFNASNTAWTLVGGGTIAPITVTSNGNGHLPNGATEGILGPFGNTPLGTPVLANNPVVALTVSSATAFDSIALTFQLWTLHTWDGDGHDGFTADYFQVAVGGSAPSGTTCTGSAFCATLSNGAGANQSYPTAGSPGQTGNAAVGLPNAAGHFTGIGVPTSAGYTVYNITIGSVATPLSLGSPTNSLTIYFRGLFSGSLQNREDESWALANAQIIGYQAATGDIPEPSTIALGGIGLALLALAKFRTRKS